MLLATYSIFLAVLAGVHPVQGGSAAWQPQLRHINKRDVVIQADPSGHAVKDALVRRHLAVKKRYLTIDPNLGDSKPWPDKTIKYCYESKAARRNLHSYFVQAANMWKTAGLASGVYKYSEVADPGTSCTGHQDRDKILVVRITPDDEQPGIETSAGYATLGIEPVNAATDYVGPEMYINTDLRAVEGRTRFIGTVAHEIGHVWGLYHEHQNPMFWQSPYSLHDGKVFGDHWYCSRVRGYQDSVDIIRAKFPDDPVKVQQQTENMCKWSSFAQDYKFAGANYLPEQSQAGKLYPAEIPRRGATNEHVDWDSIMIYNGGDFMLKNDGSPVHENNKPSQADVTGIRRIYEDSFSSHEFPTLANSKKSKWYTKWKEMMKRAYCKVVG
ncbi:hypothetical protein MCOR25_009898 [Pyricularia grisea]|uniref:Peptidase metallopeptidase domain-containing protein n=1 Tax=Pyricularia grisea TaxID=148305 RepID=A0A6P8BEC1_PYRGI|nr:uncharacterized protein PgNI_04849 [Pyricularia grisea]KAI6351486.1 hypothetical protein MCOR25_009898 [Pyricularia grisea]TLD14150.1 hypothetical protein PgNI_04849 [Pyricularia grisea]